MNIVWENTVDKGTFGCKVESEDDPYKGRLIITVIESGQVLLDEPVGIMFGAHFGPDVSDVGEWEEKAIAVIDQYLASKD